MDIDTEQEQENKFHRPWGYYVNVYEEQGMKMKKIAVYENMRLSLQSHLHRSEHWVVTKGQGRVQVGEDFHNVGPNTHIYIPKQVKHRMENTGSELLVFTETQIGNYLGEDDITRYQDDFGREGTST